MFSELFAAVYPFLQDAAASLNAGQEALPQVPDPQLVEVPSTAPPTLGDAPLEEPRIGGSHKSIYSSSVSTGERGSSLRWIFSGGIHFVEQKPNPITDGGA